MKKVLNFLTGIDTFILMVVATMIKKYGQLLTGLINQFVNILSPFIITVIGLKTTDAEHGSIWVIFLSMMVLINLFDFGLSPTTIRNISYVIGGAKTLQKDGIVAISDDAIISFPLLLRLLKDIKRIYSYITMVAFFIITLGGGIYFWLISPEHLATEIIIAWGWFSLGLLLNLYYLYYTPVLCGLGVIQHSYYANIAGKVSWLILTMLVLFLHSSIIGFSVVFVISIFINRAVSSYFYNRNDNIRKTKNVVMQSESTIPVIAYNTIKLGTVSLGSFMISRATILIAGLYLPLELAGAYTFTLQVYMALLAVGNVFVTIKVPQLSSLVLRGDRTGLQKSIAKTLSFSCSIYILGFLTFYVLANFLTELLNLKVHFLDSKFLVLLAVVYFLELTHSICATIITTQNKVPFVKPALLSGFFIVLTSYLLLKYTDLGVMGLIIAQGIIQLSYNNWKWPVMVYKEFFSHAK